MSLPQYHPRYQWLNQAAIDFHMELGKPTNLRDDELLDQLRSEIIAGLSDYFRSLTVTHQTFGINDTDDFIHDLLVAAMADDGWLMRFNVNHGTPFLGFIASMARQATTHTTRKESPGSGRTQDSLRKFRKETRERQKQEPEQDLDDIEIQVLNLMAGEGLGLEQIKNMQATASAHVIGIEDPIGDGITFGDTLQNKENINEISTIDRTTLQIKLERMPQRYRRILDSMIDQRVEGLHEVQFGADLSLAEKAVLFSTAMKIGIERTNRLPR